MVSANPSTEIVHHHHLDLKIAQAACIRDICQHRYKLVQSIRLSHNLLNALSTTFVNSASQHGSDLLGVLSRILTDATTNVSAPPEPAALALESLKFLCDEEVCICSLVCTVVCMKLHCLYFSLVYM